MTQLDSINERNKGSGFCNDLKTGPDRPVRPPAGHRTDPVHSFGPDGDRTGVGPVEPAVQLVNRTNRPVPRESAGSIDLNFFFLNDIKTTSFWCFWHQNDTLVESYLSKAAKEISFSISRPGCAVARIPLQLQLQPATPRDLADGLQQRLSDTHKVLPVAHDTKRAPLQGIPLQLQPATPRDLAGGPQQRHSQGPAGGPRHQESSPPSPSW